MNLESPHFTASEESLLQAIADGSELAFTQLMKRYTGRLLNYGRKWTSDDELIKDSIQDVFTELWLHRDRITTIDSIRAYLLASVRNRIGKLSQKALRYGQLPDEDSALEFAVTFSAEDNWIGEEGEQQRLQQLSAALNRLPARQQEIIYLKYYQNLTQAQIIDIMGISYQSVSNLLQRTLNTLRTQSAELLGLIITLMLMY